MKTLKFILASLFSNKRIVDEGSQHPFWVAIIIFLISLVIAVVPMTVSIISVQGSSLITTTENYALDYSLQKFSIDYLNDQSEAKAYVIDDQMVFVNFDEGADISHNGHVTLAVRYLPNENDLGKLLKSIKTSYVIESEETTDNKVSEIPSMLIFGKTNMYLYLYAGNATCTFTESNGEITISNETQAARSQAYNYVDIPENLSSLNSFYSVNSKNTDNILSNWENFFDKAYENPRNHAALVSSFMFLGIDVAIVIILALVLFLLSRTKSSPVKLSFLTALKFDMFATLSPAIIGMIISLFWSAIAYIGFIICFGIRATFLGMKTTSPNNNQPDTVRK